MGVRTSLRTLRRTSMRAFLIIVSLAFLTVGSAETHQQRKSSATSGISISNLTHGQSAIIADYRSAILALADSQVVPDSETRTLQNFVHLQFAYCLWGLVPGSVSYEDSPFNECSHAYLAGTRALLDRLRQAEDTRAKADDLAEEINRAMVQTGAALDICSNSFAAFNTAEIVLPKWSDISFNPLGLLLGFIILGATALAFAMSRSRRSAPM